jgi:hypothetical protein
LTSYINLGGNVTFEITRVVLGDCFISRESFVDELHVGRGVVGVVPVARLAAEGHADPAKIKSLTPYCGG